MIFLGKDYNSIDSIILLIIVITACYSSNTDKDECNDVCTQKCIATTNSSFCGCQPGYYLSSDLKTCKGIELLCSSY